MNQNYEVIVGCNGSLVRSEKFDDIKAARNFMKIHFNNMLIGYFAENDTILAAKSNPNLYCISTGKDVHTILLKENKLYDKENEHKNQKIQ